jgi:hypothetical protein
MGPSSVYARRMDQPLIRRKIAVLLGDPKGVADRVEFVFGEAGVAAHCKVTDGVVSIDVSTLGLPAIHVGERVDSWIEQAAADVAARIEWSDEPE